MNDALMTYSQLRGALLERYGRAPCNIPRSQLENHLAENIFGPLEVLLHRIKRLEQVTDRLVTDAAVADSDRLQLVTEFQDMLDQILVDFQKTLLNVPNETVELDSDVSKS